MDSGQERMETTLEKSGLAGEALSGIRDAVAHVEGMTTQNTTAAEEQSAVADEINANVIRINQDAQEASCVSGNVAKANAHLRQMVDQMGATIRQFGL